MNVNTNSYSVANKLDAARLRPAQSDANTAAAAPTDTVQRGLESQEDIQTDVEGALRNLMAGKTSGAEQFADSYGHVKHLALMLSNYVQGDARAQVLNAYKTLFTRMEPDTKFSIAVATDQDKADIEQVIKDNNVPNPERIQIVKPGLENLTVWARDMMIPEWIPGDPDHTVLEAQQPLHNWHLDDSQVPQYLTDANPSIQLQTNKAIITDGGDTQSNTKESFVGNYSLTATENKIHTGLANSAVKAQVIDWYEHQKGKEVVETPFNETFPFKFVQADNEGIQFLKMQDNPDYKAPTLKPWQVSDAQMYDDLAVDLFQAQFGKPVTVMGRDNPATPHQEEPATDHMDMGMTPIDDHTFLVGDPSLYGPPSRNRDNQEDFDSYAATLKAKGYDVFRVPHHEPQQPGDPYISYNNCLMERFEKDGHEVRRVFLPVYGQPSDDVAIKTWQSQNYEVIPMPLDKLSAKWGALRCISNWLDRSPVG